MGRALLAGVVATPLAPARPGTIWSISSASLWRCTAYFWATSSRFKGPFAAVRLWRRLRPPHPRRPPLPPRHPPPMEVTAVTMMTKTPILPELDPSLIPLRILGKPWIQGHPPQASASNLWPLWVGLPGNSFYWLFSLSKNETF